MKDGESIPYSRVFALFCIRHSIFSVQHSPFIIPNSLPLWISSKNMLRGLLSRYSSSLPYFRFDSPGMNRPRWMKRRISPRPTATCSISICGSIRSTRHSSRISPDSRCSRFPISPSPFRANSGKEEMKTLISQSIRKDPFEIGDSPSGASAIDSSSGWEMTPTSSPLRRAFRLS